MSEIAERYRKVAAQFTERVEAVPDGAWENPAPCEGWVARDVVGHLVEWLPAFFFGIWDIEAHPGPMVTDDPAGADEQTRLIAFVGRHP
ncbi:MAG: maleylpyruvate isomerase N-terminal domain-containing protein [Acidimicrobiia bacterium]